MGEDEDYYDEQRDEKLVCIRYSVHGNILIMTHLRFANSKISFPLVRTKSKSNVFQMLTLRLTDQHKDANVLHAHCILAESPNLGSF